jgi:hypothetical protein
MLDPQAHADQPERVMLLLREAKHVFSTGAAIFGGSATGAAISAALTMHVDTVSYDDGQWVTTTHNLFGWTPLTGDQAILVGLFAMLVLSAAALLLRDVISAQDARRRPAGTPLQ